MAAMISLAVGTELITLMAAMKASFKGAVHLNRLYMGMTLRPREEVDS